MSNNKLIIGTAQFIKKYGIFRKNRKQFNNFLELFKNKNITFDTSPTYSSVEKFIGRNFKNKKISSKLPSLQNIPSEKIEEKINFFMLSFDFGCDQFLFNSYNGIKTKFLLCILLCGIMILPVVIF